MTQVFILDYGVGNLLSLKVALEKVGLNAKITPPDTQLKKADAITLPGVGNFTAASKSLAPVKSDLVNVVQDGVPILGICLGLQLFFQTSEEGPGEGLALFKGKNIRLKGNLKIPHMGWNSLRIVKQNELFDGVSDGAYVYFVHSLYPEPEDKTIICAQTEYSNLFTSAVADKNIFGTQFHPEKSGDVGLQILQNFARIVSR
ncbi:MAG: imidazole glycerol phosphate synthase subunit HisH [Candidatus Bathyarchaeota archaeon]|nr:imidazole glycerol phosphate synthase subunit HisH [Candidatus Bathyarchaeota archaeon]